MSTYTGSTVQSTRRTVPLFLQLTKDEATKAPGEGPGATPRIYNLLKAASSRNVVNQQDIRFRAMEKHEHNLLPDSPRWTGIHYLRPPMNKYLFTSKGN